MGGGGGGGGGGERGGSLLSARRDEERQQGGEVADEHQVEEVAEVGAAALGRCGHAQRLHTRCTQRPGCMRVRPVHIRLQPGAHRVAGRCMGGRRAARLRERRTQLLADDAPRVEGGHE